MTVLLVHHLLAFITDDRFDMGLNMNCVVRVKIFESFKGHQLVTTIVMVFMPPP